MKETIAASHLINFRFSIFCFELLFSIPIVCTLMKVSSVSEKLEMEWFMFVEANTTKINIKVSLRRIDGHRFP